MEECGSSLSTMALSHVLLVSGMMIPTKTVFTLQRWRYGAIRQSYQLLQSLSLKWLPAWKLLRPLYIIKTLSPQKVLTEISAPFIILNAMKIHGGAWILV